ncbi:hypothetical protein NDU88_006259 [Pleurodeles waltl]|uniref:Uncharacterized protein n=1 Tax=Pleurodeles waltl TaxID=8319 RepID=A0AAV7NRA3_PLEWA|nr:hypothetical protein NDU88_006259 [Pleurodeles waltl]
MVKNKALKASSAQPNIEKFTKTFTPVRPELLETDGARELGCKNSHHCVRLCCPGARSVTSLHYGLTPKLPLPALAGDSAVSKVMSCLWGCSACGPDAYYLGRGQDRPAPAERRCTPESAGERRLTAGEPEVGSKAACGAQARSARRTERLRGEL